MSHHGEKHAAGHTAHQDHDDHHDHHGHHHETRHYSDAERSLWGIPKNRWDECTDAFLDFSNCAKDKARGGFPFTYWWSVVWSDRWTCRDENHVYKDCLTKRMLRIFEENKEEIDARR